MNPLIINSGELRHPITIQAQTTSQSASGAPQSTWNTVRTTMAAILTAGSREVYQASQLTSQVTHVVKVRWTADTVVAGNRVAFGSRLFVIQAVVNVLERNRIFLLHCIEIDGVQ